MNTAGTVRRALDSALEATVAGSWSRLGFAARRRLWRWEPAPGTSLAGCTVLVTGGTSGIGRATAAALAGAGASVGIVGRDADRTARAAAELSAALAAAPRPAPPPSGAGGRRPEPGPVWAAPADMSSRAEVEALARAVAGRTDRLAALVHAAGALYHRPARTPEGIERTAALHVVGPHLLTARLVPLLAAGAPASVVWVASGGAYLQRLDVARLAAGAEGPGDRPWRGSVAYAQAKRAQIELAHLWDDRLAARGISCVALHPGWVDTGALRQGLPHFAAALRPLLRTAEEGADTVAWLAAGRAGPDAPVALWLDRRPRGEHRWPGTAAPPGEAERLWAWCQEQAGLAGPTAMDPGGAGGPGGTTGRAATGRAATGGGAGGPGGTTGRPAATDGGGATGIATGGRA